MYFILSYFLPFLFLFSANAQNSNVVEPAFTFLSQYQNVRDFTLSSNGLEGYFTLLSPLEKSSVILKISKENGVWQEPQLTSFSGNYKDIEPFISPNGLRLYFSSNRPLNNSTNKPKDFDIWYVERKNINSDWGVPINIGGPINTEFNEFYPSLANNNNIYFTSDRSAKFGKDNIFCSYWKNNRYSDPEPLSESINTDGYEFNAFVSPTESFIIFSGYKRADGFGSGDLYISYRDKNDNWSKAINLGETINSESLDYSPFVDVNTHTLYFTSKRNSINGINNFSKIQDVLDEYNKYENGLSRIYKISYPAILEKNKE